MKFWLLIMFTIVLQTSVFSQEKHRNLFWNVGPQNMWERDFAYSPLVYQENSLGFSLGYINVGEKKTDEVYVHVSRVSMQNTYGAMLNGTHAQIMTYTFYNADWLPEKFTWGWSNANALSLRDFKDAQNFNPRFDFHTSFGPAFRYQTNFGKDRQWRFSSQVHWQLLGFLFSASYVTSPPDPFLHEQSVFNAFWQSIRLFQPFKQQDLGILNQLFYQFANGNEIGVGYRFNYVNLENAQRSQRSLGHYFVQLNFQL